MPTWNQFQPEIALQRQYGYPQSSPTSYKEQAKIELLRRLALEDRIEELRSAYNRLADQKEALELEFDLFKERAKSGPHPL